MEKEFYSVVEFAKLFRITYRAMIEAIKQGRVRAFKIGTGRRSPYRIPKSEILRVQVVGMHEVNPNLETSLD